MYIVIQREKHPDRVIEDIFGPFETQAQAETAVEMLEEMHPSDLFDFIPYPLSPFPILVN
jgi:hypothetical protein